MSDQISGNIIDILDNEEYSDDEDVINSYFNKKENSNLDQNELLDKENEDIVVGIDLGTTNSCVAIWRRKNLEIIPDKLGNRTIPSVVAFTERSRYIGRDAKKQIEINVDNTFYEVKRLIGRKFTDETVINDQNFLTYKLDKDDKNGVVISSNLASKKSTYTPEEISSIILMELKYMAEDYLKRKVDKAVITVPAYFNDSQRQATKDAAAIAGLECLRIINEPTAAALAYGLEKKSTYKKDDIYVMVYDLGGGTLDTSLLNISNGLFQVLGSSGNTHLGGADFDNRLISYCISEFKKKYKYKKLDDLSSLSFQKLKQACEDAKKRLSETMKTTIAVKDFYEDKNLFLTITRELFEKICRDLLILCLKSVDDLLKSCEIDKSIVDEIILVGGSTRMPAIKNNLKLYFNGLEPNASINPDEVVAAGAAIQGYILSNNSDPFSENVVLLDIIPLSLGVETIGGVMNTLIPRNSVIPIKKKKKYTTDKDYETSVNIRVFEGERQLTKDNFLVGEFELSGIEPAPVGISQIEITFAVDVNGIINVTALDLKNNENKKSININSNKGRLSADEINELIEEAKNAELKDRLEREKKQMFYEIEDLCAAIKLNLNSEDVKLKENDIQIIQTDLNKIIEWLKEKPYSDRNKKDYLKILDRIKKKYGTLILRVNTSDSTVKAVNTKLEATSVFENEDNDEFHDEIFEELENYELGLTDCDNEKKKEIKRIREDLISLCYSIYEIISSQNINLEKDHLKELKEYVDDVLLWIYVKEKISLMEYQQKIEEVNNVCNQIIDKYNQNEIFSTNTDNFNNSKEQLEQLCYAILGSINSNMLALHEEKIQTLKNFIENTLDWLIETDVECKKAEYEGSFKVVEEKEYQERINDINNLCNELYNSIVNLNIDENTIIVDDVDKNLFNKNNNEGSSIFELSNKK